MEFCALRPHPKAVLRRKHKHFPPTTTRKTAAPHEGYSLSPKEMVCGDGKPAFHMLKGNPYSAGGRGGSHWGSPGRQSPVSVSIQAGNSYAGDTEEFETEETSVREVEDNSEPSSKSSSEEKT